MARRSKTLSKVASQQTNEVTVSPDTVSALSATGLPAYLIDAGKHVTPDLVKKSDAIVSASKLADIGPVCMSVHMRSGMGASVLDTLPFIGSTAKDTGDNATADKYELAADPKAKKRKASKKKGKGVAAKYGYRSKEFVQLETPNGIALMGRIAELTEQQKKSGQSKATLTQLDNHLKGAKDMLTKLERIYIDGIACYQIARDMCEPRVEGNKHIQDVGVRFLSTEAAPENGNADLTLLPACEYSEDDNSLATSNDDYLLWKEGEHLDLTNKMPIEVYDVVWSLDKKSGNWTYNQRNHTACKLSDFLKFNPNKVKTNNNGKITVALLFKSIEGEAKQTTTSALPDFNLETYKSSIVGLVGFTMTDKDYDGTPDGDAISALSSECLIDPQFALDCWDTYTAFQRLFASRDTKSIGLREHVLKLVNSRNAKVQADKEARLQKQKEAAAN